MKLLKSKKALVLLGVLVVAVVAAVGAYAYFTTTGSGSGTGSVGDSTAVTLHGTAATAVTPGGATSTVTFTVDNPSSGHQLVNTIHLDSIDAFSGPGFTNPIPVGTGAGECDTSQFSMPDVVANQDFGPGNGQSVTATGTLSMANDLLNSQDGCKNAVLRLNLSNN